MKDRFKFRAWYKPSKKMYEDVCIGFIKGGLMTDWVALDTEYGQTDFINDDIEKLVLMQSTGLKDKNGKLIFEGDIVKIWRYVGNIRKTMIVQWYKHQCGFRLFDINAMGATPQKLVDIRSLGAVTSIEIIGSIYENPELLKGGE